MSKIKLYTCVNAITDYIGLNQIISYWEENGYIDRIHIPMKRDKRYISWVGREGGLALEPSNIKSIGSKYEYVLACQYRSDWANMSKVLPWNFYPRSWKEFNQVRKEMPFDRTIKSIFSGTIRSGSRRIWNGSTEIFSYRPARTYNRTNKLYKTLADYYRALGKSQFALCPVGDCPVCQREIETMGMGCVAMFGPGVEWNYFVPPIENIHFITVKDIEDMKSKMSKMGDKDMKEISHNAMEYFDKYCSPKGLWDSVLVTIDKYGIKV